MLEFVRKVKASAVRCLLVISNSEETVTTIERLTHKGIHVREVVVVGGGMPPFKGGKYAHLPAAAVVKAMVCHNRVLVDFRAAAGHCRAARAAANGSDGPDQCSD